jgi:hypothetical protein
MAQLANPNPQFPNLEYPNSCCKSALLIYFIELLFMWFFRPTGLRQQELRTGSKLRSAIEEARNLSLVRRSLDLQLLNSAPHYLNAVSPQARIRWGAMVCEEFSHHFHLGPNKPEPDQRIFLLTLCDRRCCTSHQEKNIPIARFIRILRRGLGGLSYIGMIEPAYYANVCEGARIYGKRLVSWHLHLLAWGESRKKMQKRIDGLNKQKILLPIADGLAAAHQKCISKGKLASKICYLLKSPRKAYRLSKWDTITPDGEIIPKFKQWKDDFRPGERLTVFRLMKDLYLDQLALGGGEGAEILRRVKRRVVQDLPN